MPIELPVLDDRRYQDLRDEALARIPILNPEWTNFNSSDPGVTILEVVAFVAETLLYRANQIPERNRLKFLSLLGVPLRTASAARGIVTFLNERGPLQTTTLPGMSEVRAGEVGFRTEAGLDVLPIETQVFYKRALTTAEQSPKQMAYYQQLYRSYMETAGTGTAGTGAAGTGAAGTGTASAATPSLYETTPLAAAEPDGISLASTVDGALWVALLARAGDAPFDAATLDAVRQAIAGRTLNLGIVPALAAGARVMPPGALAVPGQSSLLRIEAPSLPPDGRLPANPAQRRPAYAMLDQRSTVDVLAEPGVLQITLPSAAGLALWSNLDPLESGVGDFPPALEDTALSDRLITWLRLRSTAAVSANLLWVGSNAAMVTQRAHVVNEALRNGTGEPDQTIRLSRAPVMPGSVRLRVTTPAGQSSMWSEIADLTSAGPEVPAPDLRNPPGVTQAASPVMDVFRLDAEAGVLTFGDGAHGRRPPAGASLRADYDTTSGALGNVGVGAINNGPALPAGMRVVNPVRTWGGAAAESVAEGEKQITRYLQHRDRLVTASDFETIARRTPGVDIGRIDVLPAFHADLGSSEPGDAPGAVTLLLIPRYDPRQPDAPLPDNLFLDAVCAWLDPRRLVTTELVLRGPDYVPIYVSLGIEIVPGHSVPTVREAVKAAILRFLAPLPPLDGVEGDNGWPLRKPVLELELLAEASRVEGVAYVNRVLLGAATGSPFSRMDLRGLQLPRVLKVDVAVGDPTPLDALRGQQDPAAAPAFVPVPVIPDFCR